jgi:hypothetical protein
LIETTIRLPKNWLNHIHLAAKLTGQLKQYLSGNDFHPACPSLTFPLGFRRSRSHLTFEILFSENNLTLWTITSNHWEKLVPRRENLSYRVPCVIPYWSNVMETFCGWIFLKKVGRGRLPEISAPGRSKFLQQQTRKPSESIPKPRFDTLNNSVRKPAPSMNEPGMRWRLSCYSNEN